MKIIEIIIKIVKWVIYAITFVLGGLMLLFSSIAEDKEKSIVIRAISMILFWLVQLLSIGLVSWLFAFIIIMFISFFSDCGGGGYYNDNIPL